MSRAPGLVLARPADCDHLHETTTRYDHARKQLSFLLVCPACHTEKLVEAVPYEPRFKPRRLERKLHPQRRASARRACDHDRPAERGDAILQAG